LSSGASATSDRGPLLEFKQPRLSVEIDDSAAGTAAASAHRKSGSVREATATLILALFAPLLLPTA
jgi:hypothetical protein